MFNWLRVPKLPLCQVCDQKLPTNPGVVRLQTAEGVLELEICQECAEFFDKSTEVLQRRATNQDQQDDDE